MLRRKIEGALSEWKSRFHGKMPGKALLLTGARQVGKSFSVREFAKREYSSYAEINLYENDAAREAFSHLADVRDLITRIGLFSRGDLVPGKSLVIFDEIQELPDIITMAKFLVADGRYDYIFTGSMLGTELKGVRSFPVGSVHELRMFPLDFEEYCWAIGISDGALEHVFDAYRRRVPADDHIHAALLRNYRSYIISGGMPEAVQSFLDSGGDLTLVRTVLADLNRQYGHDIAKYSPSRSLFIKHIFDQIPQQLDDQTRRFIVNSIDPAARYDRYEQDFLWLVDAGVALKCDVVNEPRSPLVRTRQASKFKLFQSDTGMMMARYPQSTARSVYLDDGAANVGGIYENVVAQELTSKGNALYYYAQGARAEVDFIVEGPNGAVPIEVKAGKQYTKHAALDRLLATPDFHIEEGIVLSRSNVDMKGKVCYLPIYMTMCLPETNGNDCKDFKLEISAI